jgi:hypothetical protein
VNRGSRSNEPERGAGDPLTDTYPRGAADGTQLAQVVVRGGATIAALLLALGTVVHAATDQHASPAYLDSVVSGRFNGEQVLVLGIVVLAITPAVQMAALIAGWWHLRDYRFALVATALAALISIAFVLGFATRRG